MNPHFSLRSPEPLETRIAPAVIAGILVGNTAADDIEYTDAPFGSTNGIDPNFDAGDALGANFVGGTDTFYLKLTSGKPETSLVQLFSVSDGYKPFIEVKKGMAVAFFHDANMDGEVSSDELTGLSLGPGAVVEIGGSINGDIVTNFDPVTGKIAPASLVGTKQSIAGLTVGGVNAVIAGGDIKSVSATQIGFLYAGSAGDGFAYDFNGADAGGGMALGVFPLADGQKGASISKVKTVGLGILRAGDGGAAGSGGSVTDVTITGDDDGFVVAAGKGGDGNAAKTAGGSGGKVSLVYVSGLVDASADSPGVDMAANPAVQVLGGAGGVGLAGVGKGGNGGNAEKIFVGYDKVGSSPVLSTDLVSDSVAVKAGVGGDGKTGGNGGALKDARLATLTADPDNVAVDVSSGAGGMSTSLAGGKGGNGGALSAVDLRILNALAVGSGILVTGGDGGGSGGGDNAGGNGGLVSKVTAVAYGVTVQAGSGGMGSKKAGNAGGLADFTILPEIGSLDPFVARTVVLDGGAGGMATAGAGGKGGAVSKVRAEGIEIETFAINLGVGANGGMGVGGKGGEGGTVKDVRVVDLDLLGAPGQSFDVVSGSGGDGDSAGGKGGGITDLVFGGGDAGFSAFAGNGGSALVAGNGGSGGILSKLSLAAVGDFLPTGMAFAGNGGAGAGAKGNGGAGGDFSSTNLSAVSDVSARAGDGGASGGGAEGKGGGVKVFGGLSQLGSLELLAGNAGAGGGTKGAAGGVIDKASALAQDNITVAAGDGSGGGAGGDLKNVGAAGSTFDLIPFGDVLIRSGAGSAGAASAGKGGEVSAVDLFAGSGMTSVLAGDGAATAGGAKTANGGSIKSVTVNGGGGFFAEMNVRAGNGGGDAGASKGAKGGDILDLTVGELEEGTIFRDLAAGNGGEASGGAGTGGAGGKVNKVSVAGDIGIRSGMDFGFGSMGGIFAGAGGAGFKPGVAGNVVEVNAAMIASIVAGRPTAGSVLTLANLVSLVDKVFLNDTLTPTLEGGASGPDDGGEAGFRMFSDTTDPNLDPLLNEVAYAEANFVGAVVDPFAMDANQFTTTGGKVTAFLFGVDAPVDGLVAALVYPTGAKSKTNFIPETLLTVEADGVTPLLIDNDNLL